MISYIIYRLIRHFVIHIGCTVARRVHPLVARWYRNTPTAPGYVQPASGSPRHYRERTAEWVVTWGIAAMCGCLAAMVMLGLAIVLLERV